MASEMMARARGVCLSLPEAAEKETWGDATFRVRDKIFAMGRSGKGDEADVLVCKARPGVQEMLVGSDPERFYVPPYVGHNGWIGIRLNAKTDWDELGELVAESFRMTAPKALGTLVTSGE